MTRIGIMVVTGGLALLVFFAMFYLAGMALGAIVIPVAIVVALGLAVFAALRWRRPSR